MLLHVWSRRFSKKKKNKLRPLEFISKDFKSKYWLEQPLNVTLGRERLAIKLQPLMSFSIMALIIVRVGVTFANPAY